MKVRQLYEAVKTRLSPREREIILLRYGLTGRRPLVQREVAKKLNISRSYVSRLEKKALQKLRKAFDEIKKGACITRSCGYTRLV